MKDELHKTSESPYCWKKHWRLVGEEETQRVQVKMVVQMRRKVQTRKVVQMKKVAVQTRKMVQMRKTVQTRKTMAGKEDRQMRHCERRK